jgi:membrane associated rhomboid family serine protease
LKPEGGFGGASFAPPSPVVTRTIVGLCVAVQLAAMVGGVAWTDALARHAALVPGRLTGHLLSAPGDVPAPLTLLTSLFLHAGWVHLFLNLTFLLWVGRHVEIVAGRVRFVVLYLLSGIAGGLLQVAVDPGSPEQVVGASGAIAGVFGAYAVLFAQSRAGPRRILGVTIAGEVLTALWYLATWIGLQLLTAVAFNTGQGGIAIWTHIGGFVVGLIFAQPLARRFR